MRLKTKLFVTIFFTLLMKFGDAQSWIYVTSAADDAKIYINSNPVYLNSTLKVWVKTTEGKVMNDKDGVQVIPSGNMMSLIEFDCINMKYRIHTIADLDSDGNMVDKIELNGYQSPWYAIIPNSVYEKVLKKICELFSGN